MKWYPKHVLSANKMCNTLNNFYTIPWGNQEPVWAISGLAMLVNFTCSYV